MNSEKTVLDLQNIINGCIKNKNNAQQALFNMFAEEMFGVCIYYSPNRTEAEDTLHEGFLKVFQKISTFKGKGSLKGWVRKIMINTALEKYRKKNLLYLLDGDDNEFFEDIDRENIISNISADDLLHLIQELSPRYRMVFNMYALEGYSHKEISNMLGISEGTSKSNLSRARSILQKKVEKHFYLSSKIINA